MNGSTRKDIMLLEPFAYAFALASAIALLFCVALGLLQTCEFIENHASYSRKIGHRLVYASAALQVGLVVFDSVPLVPLLPSLIALLLHRQSLSTPTWPFSPRSATFAPRAARTGAVAPVLSLLLPLASHVLLTRHHNLVSHSWHLHRYNHHQRQRLPGGRLDWDVDPSAPAQREMTVWELIAVLGFCVWIVPIWRFLGSCAAMQWGASAAGGLPFGKGEVGVEVGAEAGAGVGADAAIAYSSREQQRKAR